MPSSWSAARGRRHLPGAAVDQHQVGPGVRLPVRVVARQPGEAAGQDLAHHPEVVPGRQLGGADVELAVLRLHEPFGPGDDHAADRIRAHDVAVVVDLDPLRGAVEAEGLGEGLEKRALARALRHPPRQRLAGVARRLLDQPRLLAALGAGDRHPAPELAGQRLGEEVDVVRIMADEDPPRRGLVVIELPEEALEDLPRLGAAGAREVGPVAPVLVRADEEDLHAGLAALLVQRHHVGLLDPFRVDPLVRLHVGQRPDAVADRRRPLELHRPAGRRHGLGKLLLHLGRSPGEEQYRVLDHDRIVGFRDQPDAGRAAPLDLVQEARPRPAGEHRVRAGAQQERLLQLVERPVHAAGRGEGAEVAPRLLARAAVLADLREGVAGGDLDVGEALVVAQEHVVARLQLLDQVLLQEQRLGLALRGQEHHRAGGGDHSPYACVVAQRLGVSGDALLQAARLADVEHLALGVEHPIDAGLVVEPPEIVADHQVARARRPLRRALLVEAQPRLRGDRLAVAHARFSPALPATATEFKRKPVHQICG